jgi:hypothetical protein
MTLSPGKLIGRFADLIDRTAKRCHWGVPTIRKEAEHSILSAICSCNDPFLPVEAIKNRLQRGDFNQTAWRTLQGAIRWVARGLQHLVLHEAVERAFRETEPEVLVTAELGVIAVDFFPIFAFG